MGLSVSTRQVSRGCGIAVTIFGFIGIIGSIIGSDIVPLFQQSYIPVSPISPVLFVLLGVALILFEYHHPDVQIYALIVAICTILVGIVYVAESGGGIHTGFHAALFTIYPLLHAENAGMMSPVSAVCFILIGISVLSLSKGYEQYAGVPVTIALAISSTIIFGYIFGSPLLYESRIIPVSLPSALGFILLSCGCIAQAGTENLPLSFFSGNSSRAILARYLLPGFIGLIIALEFIDHLITDVFLLNPAIVTSIEVLIALIIIIAVVIILTEALGRRIDTITASLSESEEKFRTLFENAGDAIFLMDGPVIVDCNTQTLQLFRRSREDIIGRTPADLSPPFQPDGTQSADKMSEIVDQAMHGTSRFFEWTHFHPDGERFTVEIRVNCIRMEDCPHLMVISRDITDRKKAEEVIQTKNFELQAAYEEMAASEEELRSNMNELLERDEELRESEEKFRTLFDMAPWPCTVMDNNENLLLVNKVLEDIIGYPLSDILGKRSDETGVISPDERIYLSEKLKKQGSFSNEEISVITHQGEIRTHVVSSTYVMLNGERNILSTMIDITDRKKIEEDLKRSKDQLKGIAETIPGVVFQFYAKNTGETGLSYVSGRVFEIFGVEGDLSSFMQILISGLVPEDRERFLRSINQAIQEETRWEFEGRFLNQSGTLLYFRAISAPVRIGDELVFRPQIMDITRQKETESALFESEKAYRELFNNAILGIFQATAEGEFINLNPALARMYGYNSPDEMKQELREYGRSLYVVPGDYGTIRDILTRDGEIRNYECEHHRKDGSTLWVSIHAQVIRGDTGDLHYVEGTVEDITTRKRAEIELVRKKDELQAAYQQLAGMEEELKLQLAEIMKAQSEIEKREKKFRQLFEANITGIVLHEIITDESGIPCDYRYLDANSAFETVTGHSADDLIGKTIRELKPDVDPEWIEKYGRVALTGEPIHFESYEVNKELYYDVTVYSPEKGQFATVFLDITTRKQAENIIRETNEYLENLISNALNPIMVWNPDFIITQINRSCENLLGKGADSFIGKNLVSLLSADQAEVLMHKIHLSPGNRVRDTIELKMEHQDGTIRTVVWSMSTIMDLEGERPLATIAQGWDVTKERVLEEERMMAIEKINENIAQLAILNDGIRNPLSIMACVIDSIEDPDIQKKIEDEIYRIDQMVANLDKEWINSEKILNYLKKHDTTS